MLPDEMFLKKKSTRNDYHKHVASCRLKVSTGKGVSMILNSGISISKHWLQNGKKTISVKQKSAASTQQ